MSEPIMVRMIDVNYAVTDACTCGGKGETDPGVCPACKVWHLLWRIVRGQKADWATKPGLTVEGRA